MHQESPNNSNFSSPNKQVPHNKTPNRYGFNTNLVNIQHTNTSRSTLSNRSAAVYGNVSQAITPPTVSPVKTPFSVVKGATQTTASPLIPSSTTMQHFVSPNKKVTIPNIVKPPPTTQIQKVEIKEEVVEEDPLLLRERILQVYFDNVEEIKCNFKEKLQELFFVQSGGNMVDYPAWKQRPNAHLLSFLNIYRLDDTTTLSTPTATNTISPSIKMQASYTPAGSGTTLQHTTPHIGLPNVRYSNYSEINKIIPQPVTSSVGQYGFVQTSLSSQVTSTTKKSSSCSSTSSANITPIKQEPITVNKDTPMLCKQTDISKSTFSTPTQQVTSNSTPNSSSSQDDILGQVRHESDIVQRISRLRKSGLWSASRLPKVYEQARKKSQWDFLLEEMQWLATDFTQEKKWKRSMAKKISRSVMKFHQDKAAFQRKLKKEENARLKRVAGGIAKEVKLFWRQIEKVACYKQQSRQEEQRRKALDLHLNFIVGQTEKYSSWLAEGMKDSSISSEVSSRQVSDGDDDFEPGTKNAADDEETIAEEESIAKEDGKTQEDKYQEELDALKEDSEMPMEDLLKTLPSDMLARISGKGDKEDDGSSSESEISVGGMEEENNNESGEEYVANEQEMKDDEKTIEAEEAMGEVDHKEELDELQNEADMPIEELRKMYGLSHDAAPPPEETDSDSDTETDFDSESISESLSESEGEVSETNTTNEEPTKVPDELATVNEEEEGEKPLPNQQLTDAAATAESLQPKGFTLSTTQVKTKVPFLLRHTLREYQHIGLDWLVTMYQKQLNGILADEMGLGKTIQTIALLAHLACEEEIWGPHLIVVPTSVILNWEFEFKKWCPGFKILAYFGNQKERKFKRSGWMKPNAFHVCITSYNLVIQDHQAFRRRKWKYLILDEAQNIKNFKSQRWQMLLNFHSQRRLLLTGTPLQNHLMELWSLMHFLMPNIFHSHQDFKEWFANPLTGMIEGSTEYNEGLIKRLHTVLRPFLLRRLKSEVELQMPKKYEHVMKCRLSKRQRFLYDEFMSRTKTKETLEAGNFLSVINILMQLRKVCNHPDLFELRPTVSPYVMDKLEYATSHLVDNIIPNELPLGNCLAHCEQTMCAFQAHRTRQLKIRKSLMQNLYDSNVNYSSVESRETYLQNRMSSSQFQPLCNATGEVLSGQGETEITRSYLDCMTPSVTTAGNSTIGDILTRQIEQSLDCETVIDVVNDVSEAGNELYCPVAKKQKINNNRSYGNNKNSNSNNYSNITTISSSGSSCNKYIGNNSYDDGNSNNNNCNIDNSNNDNLFNNSNVDNNDNDNNINEDNSKVSMNVGSDKDNIGNDNTNEIDIDIDDDDDDDDDDDEEDNNPSSSNTTTTASTGVNSNKSNSNNKNKNNKSKKSKSKTGLLLGDFIADEVSPFYLSALREKNEEELSSRLCYGAEMNERHCEASPVYGLDLHHAVKVCHGTDRRIVGALLHQYGRNKLCPVLEDIIKTPARRLLERKNLTERFLLYIYPVLSHTPTMKTIHVVPSREMSFKRLKHNLRTQLHSKFNLLAPMVAYSRLQFPETRLVQYDCGKLQTLDMLLRRLKAGKHRVLIFTQMTRMLDVLERFLNYHGFIYLRLDGSTKVDQRQILMERFNKDEKIFVFILSTRSGGIGVNLTGADTVIFYDSDWNPTMDAQAQDRCHRIGQTRDVHIYRLISDKTVEENILKKAQNKRLLGNIAIEGGNFTAAYFKQHSIKELFEESCEEPTSLLSPIKTDKKEDVKAQSVTPSVSDVKEPLKNNEYEEVLSKVEEEDDAKAAERAKIEQDCELAEFHENAPATENAADESKVEKALAVLESELKPIERFALKFMELTHSFHVEDEIEETEKMLALRKKEWELDHLQSMKEAEEKKHAEEDDMFFTYARDDTYSKVINTVSPHKGESKPRRRSRKKTEEIEISITCGEEEEEDSPGEVSPTSGNIHFRIKPLIMKLGNERIAQIKKVAQEAIEAKTIQSASDLVKTRVRKKAEFFNSGSTTPTSPISKPLPQSPTDSLKKVKQNAQHVTHPKHKMSSQKVKAVSHKAKPASTKVGKQSHKTVHTSSNANSSSAKVNQGSGKVNQMSAKVSQGSVKASQSSAKFSKPSPSSAKVLQNSGKVSPGFGNVDQDGLQGVPNAQKSAKKGRPYGKKQLTSVAMETSVAVNPLYCKPQPSNAPIQPELSSKNGNKNTFNSQQQVNQLPRNRGAVTLKDFISQSQSNLFLKPPPSQPTNVEPPLPLAHEAFTKIDATIQNNSYNKNNVISNGINPYLQNNNTSHDTFSDWNGIIPSSDFSMNPYMDRTCLSLPKFTHNSIPDTSRIFPNYDLNNIQPVAKGNSCMIPNNDMHSFNYHNSNNDIGYANTISTETNTPVLPARPLHLSQISSAASSPLHSPASSSDSGGDVRRSSRTPRPKTYDNADWFLFS